MSLKQIQKTIELKEKAIRKTEKKIAKLERRAQPKYKMFSRTAFLNILEKATSHLQLEPDWNAIIAVSDCIRQGDVEPKFALNSIKKKLTGPNLHVNMFALLVLESCVKNCGPTFHAEVATKSFMEDLYEIVKGNTNEKIKEKILELVQAWAHAFRNQFKYRPVLDMCNLLKLEGFKFPQLKEADAMFSASVAPEWVDGDCCNRCQVFCNKCSSKQSIIPKFGIEKEVRVCEDCYEKINSTTVLKPTATASKTSTTTSNQNDKSTASKSTTPGGKSEEELREEEELQMAIALSKSEAEIKEKEQKRYSNSYNTFGSFENEVLNKPIDKEQLDPNLNLYMNRAYWEQKSLENSNKRMNETPSAPQQTLIKNKEKQQAKSILNEQAPIEQNQFNNTAVTTQLLKSCESNDDNIEQFQNNLKSTIEIFVNRMNSNKNRGRPISNDSAVQSMFLNITNMHSQLLKHIQQQDDLRNKFEILQDKLSQARDARAALDSLREEYNEKIRREAEEAEMIRQQQMAYKLDMMRKKKQEYLQYQHQIALQRVQDQEREMKMRMEQQKYGAWQQNVANQLPINPPQQQYQQPNDLAVGYQMPPPNHHYNNYDYNQINNQNLSYVQQNGNLTQPPPQQLNQPIHQIPVLPQSPHLPPLQPPQQQIVVSNPPQPLPSTQSPHVPMPNSTATDQTNSNPQYQYQGVYNMQALNNSLPTQQPQNQSSQQQINQQPNYVTTQVNQPEPTNEINNLPVQVNRQVEEAPLISFD